MLEVQLIPAYDLAVGDVFQYQRDIHTYIGNIKTVSYDTDSDIYVDINYNCIDENGIPYYVEPNERVMLMAK